MKPNLISKVRWRFRRPNVHLSTRIIILFLFCGITNVFSLPSYSQGANLTIHINNAPIEEVLNQIEKQSEFRFLYNKKIVDVNRKVSISSQNKPVSEILNQIFSNGDITYTIHDRQIVLAPKTSTKDEQNTLQATTITGRVVDNEGESLPGVSIAVKGTTQGVMTDLDGYFSISTSAGTTLVISYIGYLSQEIKVGNNTKLDIKLQEATKELEAVVIVGFGTQKKESITGAISAISGSELMTTNASTTSTALAGKIAGLNTRQPDGRPGW